MTASDFGRASAIVRGLVGDTPTQSGVYVVWRPAAGRASADALFEDLARGTGIVATIGSGSKTAGVAGGGLVTRVSCLVASISHRPHAHRFGVVVSAHDLVPDDLAILVICFEPGVCLERYLWRLHVHLTGRRPLDGGSEPKRTGRRDRAWSTVTEDVVFALGRTQLDKT